MAHGSTPVPSFLSRRSAWALAALSLLTTRIPAQAPGSIVALLETRTPVAEHFLLRGTIPLPPGIHPDPAERNPFTILDIDGRPLLTQVEIVSRYPRDDDGADVVELLARVRRDPDLPVGAPVRYAVALRHPMPPSHAGADLVPRIVRRLLADPDGIEIAAIDCFGNRYSTRPLAQGAFTLLRHGPVQSEVRIYQSLLPDSPNAGTLPHLMGVHTYLSFFQESTSVELDLRFHNAHDGHDPNDPSDDALGKIYFKRLEVSIPEAWTLQQDFPDPLFGAERLVDGRRIVELVGPEPAGGLHVMRWGAQFHRRLMLAPDLPAPRASARALLDGVGRAFAVRGFDRQGHELWSWWNAATARWFPQRLQLPLLDHVGRAALDAGLEDQLAFVAGHLRSGAGDGDYPISAARLGWGHPYGVPYGGMTSGTEINCTDGVPTVAAASPSGFLLYTALHRMHSDRQPDALYQRDGTPSSVEEWLIENGTLDYIPFEHFIVPLVQGGRSEPFGLGRAPRFQVDYVEASGLQPAYESAHFTFDPHDYQHFIRYTRSAKVLAWLGNDSIAKDDLCMQAEAFHLSFNSNANASNGAAQDSGMLSMQRFVATYPGQGCPYGRGEAWGLDCASAVYSCASRDWRARKLPWLEATAELLLDAQGTCNGFIQAQVSSQAVGGRYRARQLIEQSITENALIGLHESVFREADPGHARMVRDVLERSLRAFIGEMSWFPGELGPWRYSGLGPRDPGLPVWCSRAEMPADAWTAGDIETYQDWGSFAYGYELTGDPEFLRYAGIQIGAPDLAGLGARLAGAGTANLENRAPLLTLVQRLLGQL